MRPTSSSVRMTRTRLLFDAAAHGALLAGAPGLGHVLQLALGVHAVARRVAGEELEDAGADEDAVALFQAGTLDLLAVDEGPVGRTEILDPDLVRLHGDARVLARDHVLHQHHVQIARPADEDLLLGCARKFTPRL